MFTCGPAFMMPTALAAPVDPYFADVILLARLSGADGSTTFVDSSTRNVSLLNTSGAEIKSFADASGGSALYRGTIDNGYVYGSHPEIAFGTGDFTIECFVKEFSASGQHGPFQVCTPTPGPFQNNQNLAALRGNTGNWVFYAGGQVLFSAIPVQTDVRTHLAMSRQSGILRIFVNGAMAFEFAHPYDYTGTGFALRVYYNNSYRFDGYVDDFRISAIARYTAAFVPPTEAF